MSACQFAASKRFAASLGQMVDPSRSASSDSIAASSARSLPRRPRPRQRLEQWRTRGQSRAHFARQEKRLPQTLHTFFDAAFMAVVPRIVSHG